ncbi:BrnA antitoxin family protein [Maritalea sp.]|uniref:BrnA antitoxin family protein n=1 Tax=Maritalea sp. TaxID=2003361 RepID=UPI003EF3C10C
MTKSDMKTVTLEELRVKKTRGELLPTKKAAIQLAPKLDDGFWDEAEIVERVAKKSVHLRVDEDVLEFFKSEGKGHLTRMNAVLRSYMSAKNTHR